MRLIINTVNLKIGGAFQRSISFMNELKSLAYNNDEYHIFYNDFFSQEIDVKSYSKNFHFYHFTDSPASLSKRRKIVSKFHFLENEIKPDIVFSFVGPCYWRTKSPHLVGFGVPHIVYNDYDYLKKISLKSKLEMLYKKFWTKKEADYYVVQTNDVKKKLSKVLNISESNIYVVSNGVGNQYKNITPTIRTSTNNVKKLLLISTYRPSKNFEIINEVIPFLEDDNKFDYEFHITIKEEEYERLFKNSKKRVKNHGHVLAKDCPGLYNESDAMFLPSHLECFSASYPEAMKMKKPILTSDFSFAHTVCDDAAIYFDNKNAKEIAEKIKLLFHNETLYNSLIFKGQNKLLEFDTSTDQAQKYLKICKQIIEYTKN